MKRTGLLIPLFLVVLILLGFAACGKDKAKNGTKDSNLLSLGEYELLYKDAKIMEDSDGDDALVLSVDFVNNSKDITSYVWSIFHTAVQNGTELDDAVVFVDNDSYDLISDSQLTEVKPATTLEIQLAFVLVDAVSEVEVNFEELAGDKDGNFIIDPSALNRESVNVNTEPSVKEETADAETTGDPLFEWWNGDWYGYWIMTDCYGYYDDMEGMRYDICGTIEIGADYTGTVLLWDEGYTKSFPMVSALVSLNEAATGEYGTVISEGGDFMDAGLGHADWIVDPGLAEYQDMIHIDGSYEVGDHGFRYDIYLRPWGRYWDDVEEESLPFFYYDLYLPMIEADLPMPDGMQTYVYTMTIPGGDGIVTEEQLQKGYVWMSEVARDIFGTTYESLADYFGVGGCFVKEEYSDHMQANYRYYKWISSENSSHYIYVNFEEQETGEYTISAYNTSGFSGSEAVEKYLDIVKAEAAKADKSAAADVQMKDFSKNYDSGLCSGHCA